MNDIPIDGIAEGETDMAELTREDTYRLEEMKQLRGLISVLVQEIAKLEIFAITALAAVMAFYLKFEGPSSILDWIMQFGPLVLSGILLGKAFGFARRIKLIDDHLLEIEKDFTEKGWIKIFRDSYSEFFRSSYSKFFPFSYSKRIMQEPDASQRWSHNFILVERLSVTLFVTVLSILLAVFPPSRLKESKKTTITPFLILHRQVANL